MAATGRSNWRRRAPLIVIVVVAIVAAFTLRDQISFEALARHREALLSFRDANYALAALIFVAVYAVMVLLSLPGALVATLTGGFLFGVFPGVLFNVTAATLGAMAVFVAARAGLGSGLQDRLATSGKAGAALMTGLRENEIPVLLLMRLVPVVPFFLANLIPAALGIGFARFAATTFFGIMPGSLVYTWVGAGLGEVFAAGETPNLGLLFEPHVLGPILGLAALAALPMALNILRKRNG